MAYTRYKGDPYWKRANVDGTSADGTPSAELIAAQAAGDSAVLAEHGRPVVTLTVSDADAIAAVIAAAS